MIKAVKIIGLIIAGLVLYGTGSGLTYRLHESRWPGPGPYRHNCEEPDNGSLLVAVVWPVGLPITLGILTAEKLVQ